MWQLWMEREGIMGQLYFNHSSTPNAIKKILQHRTRAKRPIHLQEIYNQLKGVPRASIRRTLYCMKQFGQAQQDPIYKTWEWVSD